MFSRGGGGCSPGHPKREGSIISYKLIICCKYNIGQNCSQNSIKNHQATSYHAADCYNRFHLKLTDHKQNIFLKHERTCRDINWRMVSQQQNYTNHFDITTLYTCNNSYSLKVNSKKLHLCRAVYMEVVSIITFLLKYTFIVYQVKKNEIFPTQTRKW